MLTVGVPNGEIGTIIVIIIKFRRKIHQQNRNISGKFKAVHDTIDNIGKILKTEFEYVINHVEA